MRNVKAMGIVSFFTDFSTEMVLGLLPIFVISSLGGSRALLGAIEGSADLVSYAFRMVSGSASDKIGRRKIFVVLGYSLSAFTKPLFAFVQTPLGALAVRVSDRMGKGIRTAPRDALIADSVPESVSGKAFGIHRTMDQFGAVVGPLVAFALVSLIGIRGVFLFSLVPGLIGVLVLVLFVREVAVKRSAKVAITANILRLLRQNRQFVLLLVVTAIFSAGAFNFSFVILRSTDYGVDKNAGPLIYAVINIAHTAIGYPSGTLSDRIGKPRMLMIGYGVFVVSALMMAIPVAGGPGVPYAYLLAAVYGVYAGITETLQRAIIPRFVKSEERGTAYGLYNLVTGIGLLAGGVVFGFLWDSNGILAASIYSMLLAAISAALLAILFAKK
jgi:MFS family permease